MIKTAAWLLNDQYQDFPLLDLTRAYGLTFLFPENDSAIGFSLRNYGEFARPEVEIILDYLGRESEPGTFLDLGANIGSIALPVAAFRKRWKVLAVEAHRGLAGVLTANALNNQLYNVEAINAAVGDEARLVQFPKASLASKINFGVLGLHMNETQPTETVRMCTVDEIAPANTRMIKMDVEGFEPQVLKGAGETIRNVKPIWLLEANPTSRDAAIETMLILREAGYRLFWLWAPFVSVEHRKPAIQAPKVIGDLNFIALPQGVENIWDLPPVGDPEQPWPARYSEFRYLERFGFKLQASQTDPI